MKRISIFGLSLTTAVVMGLACKPCPESDQNPARANGAAEARKAPQPMAARARTATERSREGAQACAAEHLDTNGSCLVDKMWPKCEEARLVPAEPKKSDIKRCETEFKPLKDATADDLSYPQCEVVCRDNSDLDTQRCDDPIRCKDLPECGSSGDPQPCCDKTVDQVDIDRRYLDFAWRMFIAINNRRPGEAKPDWMNWAAPFAISPEAESVLPKNVSRAKSSVRSGLDCLEREVPDALSKAPWNDDKYPAAMPELRSNPISYKAPDGHPAYVQFQTLISRESQNARSSLLGNACTQALLAASQFRLDEIGWWQGNHQDIIGAVHLKAAWIRVHETDCGKEFICGNPDKGPLQGLVALHITAKSNHSESFWTWATFEHVRAVDADGNLPALFSGASEPNECPKSSEYTHIERLQFDYPGAADYRKLVDEINRTARETLKREATAGNGLGVLARYRLAGVQRPRTEGDKVIPWPTKLSNVVIEWDHQDSSCMGCHSRATSWRLCAPDEPDCEPCKAGCPSVKLDWVPQRAQSHMVPQSDMFWGYHKATPQL